MKLILLCPKCKNSMQYESRSNLIANKTKRCVYCGRYFTVSKHVIKHE